MALVKDVSTDPVKESEQRKNKGESAAGLFSRITFSWVTPLVSHGFKTQLNKEDLFELSESEDVALLKDKFWEHLNKNLEPGKPCSKWSLFRSLMHVCKRDVIVSGLFMLLYTITQLANPVILRELIIAISDDGYLGLYYATILFISGIISAFGSQFHFHYAYTAGRKVRGLFIALVYERTLQLSSADLASTSSGEIINMFSADAQKFFETSQFMHLFWAGPLQIIVGIVFLLIVIGLPALAGIAMLTLILPINVGTASLKRSLRACHMPLMDKRVKLSTEILSGIRLVKLFSWEKPLMQKLRDVRELQLRYVFKELFLFAAIITILIITPTLSTMATFATYGATSRVLKAGDTFAALAFFTVLKFPLMQISQGMLMGAQSIVATERLFTFLDIKGGHATKDNLAENTKPVSEARDNDEDSSNKTVVEMTNASFSWQSDIPTLAKATPKKKNSNKKTNTRKESNKKLLEEDDSESQTQDKVVLKNIYLTIRQGELVACVGPVGAGKSSLCHALLSELVQVEGKSTFELDKIAYAGQEPWILNDTVENNILFGEEYDEARFRQALDASCLWSDLEQFSDREKTMIGERGVTLSGGQKARVSIARAIYSQPDFVILDDPLSALDAHVGKKVFDQLFSPTRGLLRNKTCFLVTHAVQYMSVCDKVIVLYKGRIAFHGSFEDLKNRYVGTDSPDQGTEAADAGSVQAISNQNMTDLGELSAGSLASVMHSILQSTQESNPERNTESIREASTDVIDSNVVRKPKELFQKDYTSSKLMTTEERKFGSAYAGTLHQYILASGGYLWMIFVILLLIIERVSYLAADYWLSVWTEAETGPPVGALVFDFPAGNTTEGIQFYTNGYIAAIVINAFLVLVQASAFMYGGGRAARSMFNKLSWSVIRAPIAWFEQTPLGRITNRFSFDTEVIDDLLIQSLNGVVAPGLWILSAIIVMVSVTPPAAALIFPVMITFAMLHRYYRKSCVDLQRLDSTSRSPIQSHFRESIDGLTTLRAHKQQARFSAITNRMINQNNEAIFAFVSSNRWLGIRLEFLGGLITFAVAVSAWFSRGTISPGLVGLAVLWSFNLTASFNFFVTLSTQAEAKMTSVERVSHYATTLEQEPPLETMGSKPDPSWPAHGGLEFKNVVMRYRPDLPPVLNNLNFRVSPGEHVGIVGRSGAGKSSISVVMFRLREASEGTITVDGIDLSQLGLRDVRGRAMFIITQEAVLFSGTIRSNLDMFNEYTDQEVMQALERARIADYVRQIGGINATVEEGGGNLSAGQRQLVALARALLRQPKILLMDEATASCDVETDGHIQETIRREFRSTTVISIAHRLGSIMDFHRVMVMQKGKVAEFDTPANLLEKKGAFHVLVESTGPAMSQQLRQIAIQTQESLLANQ